MIAKLHAMNDAGDKCLPSVRGLITVPENSLQPTPQDRTREEPYISQTPGNNVPLKNNKGSSKQPFL